MFFMVELGAVLSACIVYFTFRKEKGSIPKSGKMTEVEDFVPTVLLVGAIAALIVASFLPFEMPAETNGLICSALLVIGLIYTYGDGQCGPKSLKLYNFIKGIQRGELEDVFNWNVFVD